MCGVGGSGGHQLGEVGGGVRYCGGMVHAYSLLHTWEMVLVIMVVTVRVVVIQWEGGLLSWSGTCDLGGRGTTQ